MDFNGRASVGHILLTPHLDFVKNPNLTPRLIIEKAATLLDESFARETKLFLAFMATRDIAPSSIPGDLTENKNHMTLYGDDEKSDPTTIIFGNLGQLANEQLWITCEKLQFKERDYISLLVSVTKHAVFTEFLLKNYKAIHLNTIMLRSIGELDRTLQTLHHHASEAQRLLENFLIAPYLEESAKCKLVIGPSTYRGVELIPSLSLFSRETDQGSAFLNTEWASFSNLYRYSRWLLLDSLARKHFPDNNPSISFAGAILPPQENPRDVKRTLAETMTLTAGLLNDTIEKIFYDHSRQLIKDEEVIDRFVYLLETYYLFKEANFCRFARLHGKKIPEAPRDFFSRRMVISINLANNEHGLIEVDGIDKEQLRKELTQAGVSNVAALEMMKTIIYHLTYEAIFRPAFNIHEISETKTYTPEQVTNLFGCYLRMGETAVVELTNFLNGVMSKHTPCWNQISASAKKNMGNLTNYRLGFQTGYDMQDIVEGAFDGEDLSWGRLAFVYKLDQLKYLSETLKIPEVARLLDSELAGDSASVGKERVLTDQPVVKKRINLQQLIGNGNSKLDAMRTRLKKKAEEEQNKRKDVVVKNQAVKPPVAVTLPINPKATTTEQPTSKAKKKKNKARTTDAVTSPVVVEKVAEQPKPQEEVKHAPVTQPTLEQLHAELGTLKLKEQQLVDQLATTKACNEGLQGELAEKASQIESLEEELTEVKVHVAKLSERLKKKREKARNDLLAKDALINVAKKEKQQAEDELKANQAHAAKAKQLAEEGLQAKIEEITKELEALKVTSATAVKTAQEKGEKDFDLAQYRIKLLKQDLTKAESTRLAVDQKLIAADKSREEAEQKLKIAEEENRSLREQLLVKQDSQAIPVTVLEENEALKAQLTQLHQQNMAYQDTFAKGNDAYMQQMGGMQLALDTAHAEIKRLQELLASAGVGGIAVLPTSKLEIELAFSQKVNENLKAKNADLEEQLDNNKIVIRELKKQLGQSSDNSQSE